VFVAINDTQRSPKGLTPLQGCTNLKDSQTTWTGHVVTFGEKVLVHFFLLAAAY